MKSNYFIRHLCHLATFTVLFCLTVSAQENNQTDISAWTTIATEDGELKVDFPAEFLVNGEKKGTQRYSITGYKNGVNMRLTVYKQKRNPVGDNFRLIEKKSEINTTMVEKNGMTIINTIDKKYGYSHGLSITSDDYLYVLSANAMDENVPELKRFLYSIKLKDSPFFKFDETELTTVATQTVAGDSLKTSPEVSAALDRKIVKNKDRKVIYEEVLGGFDLPRNSAVTNMREAIILEKEPPRFNFDPRNYNASSIRMEASVEVELLANGQVGDIRIFTNGGSKDFSRACVKSAEKLKFIPAEIDGKPVDSKQIIEYRIMAFSIQTTNPY